MEFHYHAFCAPDIKNTQPPLCDAARCVPPFGRVYGKKNEPKPKLFGPDIFGWGGGLPREGVGPEKFDMSIETRETKLFWLDIPGFCRDIPEAPEKFEKKKVRVQLSFPRVIGCNWISVL